MIMHQIKLAARQIGLLLILGICLLPVLPAQAEGQSAQAWSILRYTRDIKGTAHSFYAQLQHRYNFEEEALFEEQLNLSMRARASFAELGVIGSVVTEYGYERAKENRLALEGTRSLWAHSNYDFSVRLRHEFRDFADEDKVINRFRVRPQLQLEVSSPWVDEFVVSSELNVYLDEFSEAEAGFSSLRTIFEASRSWDGRTLGLSYVNDYREFIDFIEVRHVLLLGLSYQN